MIKFSETYSYDFGMEPTALIKGKSSLEKRAAEIDKILKNYKKDKNQEDLHIIAVGAYEGTGFNRNLDCFKEYWCEKNAHYFTDSDRAVHRHHKNKKTDPKFGNIKVAVYNGPMRRIELIVGLDKDKCGDILHEQEKVGHTNWSMASKQKFDTCTLCKHAAYTDEDRCEHIPSRLGEMTKEGTIIGMDNPDPHWFEISYVKRPADRIGMSLGKMASQQMKPMLPSDYLNLYTGFEVPPEETVLVSKTAADKRVLLKKLSELEKHISATSHKDTIVNLTETDKIANVDELRQLDPQQFLKFAADNGIILNPDNFFNYVFGDKIKEAQVTGAKTYLPHIFSIFEKEGSVLLNDETFDVKTNSICTKVASSSLVINHSLFLPYVQARQARIAPKQKTAEKNESGNALDKELALQYANYKLATLNYLSSKNKLSDDLLNFAILQNNI